MFGRHDFGQQRVGDGQHAAGREPHHEAHENIPGKGWHGSADGGAHEHDGREQNRGAPPVNIGQRSPDERPHSGAGQRDHRQDRDACGAEAILGAHAGSDEPEGGRFHDVDDKRDADQPYLYPMGLGERRVLGRGDGFVAGSLRLAARGSRP